MRARPLVRTLISTVAALATGLLIATPALAAPADSGSHVSRACARATTPGQMACFALRRTDVGGQRTLAAGLTPSGYGPSDLRSAYSLTSNGSPVTVAIVDAYDDPNAESDLATYRSTYGLPACTTANGCFRKVNENGGSTPPSANSGWAGEISLDLDMVSAICPACHILLVEASSANEGPLYTAVDYAASQADYVSNSWGGAESGTQTSDDAHFNHPGVAITVSTGDSGTGAEYPATSRYVTAVGGTSLRRSGSGWSESAWSDAGSGCSSYDAKPSWQNVTTGCSRRAEADVSAVADPNTGVAVYQTYGGNGWAVYGGTSAAAPIIAAVYALAGTPGASDYPASYPYAHASSLNDVTSGSNGGCGAPICSAGPGWDGPTGLGTPNGTAAFTAGGGGGGPGPVSVNNPGSQSSTVGTAVSLSLSASGGTGSYTWSASGLPAGLSINASSGVISGTPTAEGTSTVTVTATDSANASGSTSFTWNVTSTGGGGGGTCSQPAWDSSTVYVGGDQVSYNGHVWTARWWTQGETPGTSAVWMDGGACGGGGGGGGSGQCAGLNAWQATAVYVGGDSVTYGDHKWTARWWTQGDTPGSAYVWADNGAC